MPLPQLAPYEGEHQGKGRGGMEQAFYLATLVGTALVLAAAFSSLIAFRFGAPLLLLFLGIGLATGVDGLGIAFDNAGLAYFAGSLALAVILFDSGFGTPASILRQAAGPAIALATVGVALTTGLFALAAHTFAGFAWAEALLLGAIVASTDAAAVFFLLRAGNINLRERVRSTLEIESGTNDPIAIFLTITLVELITGHFGEGDLPWLVLAAKFALSMGLGAAVGIGGGLLIARMTERLDLDRGLLPIFVLALSMLVFAAAGTVGGSGFLAVYLAGLVTGNSRVRSHASLKRFYDGMSWLAQIIMFLVLGLFATPSEFLPLLPTAIALGLFLILVARPLAVWLCLLPFRFPRNEAAFIAWVGLRGAVSILLGLTPILGFVEGGRTIFNVAFIVVLVSLLVQGWTVGFFARRLGLIAPRKIGPLEKVELELPGSAHHELLAYTVVPNSPVTRAARLPRWARPSLVIRDGRSMRWGEAGRIQAGDHVYIFVPDRYPRLLDRLFASPARVEAGDTEFFGDFSVDPSRPAAELAAAYEARLSETERRLSIGALVAERLGGAPEYADRVTLGPIDLIVRATDENGRVSALGLSFEPATVETMPIIPGARLLRTRLSRFFSRSNRRDKAA